MSLNAAQNFWPRPGAGTLLLLQLDSTLGGPGDCLCEILCLDMALGEDDRMAPRAAGSVRIRGLLARMCYLVPGSSRMHVG